MKNNSQQNPEQNYDFRDEDEINEQDLRSFIEELLQDQNFQPENIAKNRKTAPILESLPKKLREYLQEIQRLEQENSKLRSQETDEKNPKTKSEVEAEKKRRDRVREITKEVFIISCASSKPLEKSLEFFDKCKIDPQHLSKFGECGLSALTASIMSGQSEKMQGLIERGVSVNEKNAYGFTARDFAEMIGDKKAVDVLKENGAIGINSQQRQQDEELQRQRNAEKESEKKARSDILKEQREAAALKRQEAEFERLQQEQSRIYRAMAETYEHFVARENLLKEVVEKAQKTAEEKQSTQLREAQLNQRNTEESKQREVDFKVDEMRDREIVASNQESRQDLKSKEMSEVAQTSQNKFGHEETEKLKPLAKAELEKILQVDLDKVDINKLLFNAVKEGQPLIAVLLINCGADVNHREGSKTIIDVAVDSGSGSMIGALSMFTRREVLCSAISRAVENGNYFTLELREALIGNKPAQPESEVVGREDKKSARETIPGTTPHVFEMRAIHGDEVHKRSDGKFSFREMVVTKTTEASKANNQGSAAAA